jgi:hypothetical protein
MFGSLCTMNLVMHVFGAITTPDGCLIQLEIIYCTCNTGQLRSEVYHMNCLTKMLNIAMGQFMEYSVYVNNTVHSLNWERLLVSVFVFVLIAQTDAALIGTKKNKCSIFDPHKNKYLVHHRFILISILSIHFYQKQVSSFIYTSKAAFTKMWSEM